MDLDFHHRDTFFLEPSCVFYLFYLYLFQIEIRILVTQNLSPLSGVPRRMVHGAHGLSQRKPCTMHTCRQPAPASQPRPSATTDHSHTQVVHQHQHKKIQDTPATRRPSIRVSYLERRIPSRCETVAPAAFEWRPRVAPPSAGSPRAVARPIAGERRRKKEKVQGQSE